MVHCTVMLVFDNYVDESEISLLKAQTWLKRYYIRTVELSLNIATDGTLFPCYFPVGI